ncbi:MAG: hypothetical protein JWR04_1305 [Rhodoglobus sp.]|nr:hypothetical protein [Rhodoglobus sp.]
MRPVLALLVGGGLVVVAGCLALWRSTAAYLDHPLAPSSTSGNRVYLLPDGSLGAYPPFAVGLEPAVIGCGVVVVVLACFVGAVLHSRRPRIDG